MYASQTLKTDDQPLQGTMKMSFLVDADTIKRVGAQNILLTLAGQECKVPCFVDLWDSREAFQLNEDNPFGRRTDKWQKQHFVSIADHLVAAKMSANDDEVINYPLTYDSNYKRWGGKRKH